MEGERFTSNRRLTWSDVEGGNGEKGRLARWIRTKISFLSTTIPKIAHWSRGGSPVGKLRNQVPTLKSASGERKGLGGRFGDGISTSFQTIKKNKKKNKKKYTSIEDYLTRW